MRDVRQKLERVAGANLSVLISGESGTGKDIVARLLHLYSPWSNGPFVKVNCPAIPGTLLCFECSEEVGGDFIYTARQENLGKAGSLKLNYGGVSITKKRRRIQKKDAP